MDLILQYNTMKLIIHYLKSSQFREIQGSPFRKQRSSSFTTPIRQLEKRRTLDSTDIPQINSPNVEKSFSKHKEISTEMKIIPQQPSDAFRKKCFANRQSIRLINDLQKLYDQKPISKTQYKFKANRPFSQSGQNRSSSYAVFHKKGVKDRLPFNLMAVESAVKHKSTSKQGAFDRLSHSKRIKYSIIGNSYGC